MRLLVCRIQVPREDTHSHDKGVIVKTWIDFWCKQKLVHHPPIHSRQQDMAPTKTRNSSARFSPTRFVGAKMSWTGSRVSEFGTRREREYLFSNLPIMLALCFTLLEIGD